MTISITWRQALAWRMRRHFIDPVGAASVESVVDRLCGVQAQVASSAELAIRLRQSSSRPGEVGQSLADGRLIRTWAMRGTLHLLTPAGAGAFLSLIAASRPWQRPSWIRYFGMTPEAIEALRAAVRDALSGDPLSREELIEAVTVRPGLDAVGGALRSGWGTLLKPLAWQGELCFGPSRGTRVTFTRPDIVNAAWPGLPSPEVAAPVAIEAYLGAYGPASMTAFGNWLAGGSFGKRWLQPMFEAMGDRLTEIDVEGERVWIRTQDADELAATQPTTAVRLLSGFDQYVLGPGTGNAHILAPARRAAVSRTSGWIAPIVVSGGVISGTWQVDGAAARVAWFREAGKPPVRALTAEVERLSGVVGRRINLAVELG